MALEVTCDERHVHNVDTRLARRQPVTLYHEFKRRLDQPDSLDACHRLSVVLIKCIVLPHLSVGYLCLHDLGCFVWLHCHQWSRVRRVQSKRAFSMSILHANDDSVHRRFS